MYVNKFGIYINGNFLVSGYLYYYFTWNWYNECEEKGGDKMNIIEFGISPLSLQGPCHCQSSSCGGGR